MKLMTVEAVAYIVEFVNLKPSIVKLVELLSSF